MKTSLSLFSSAIAIVAVSTCLRAQSVETATNAGVFAKAGSVGALKFVKKGTKLSLPATVSAAVRSVGASTRVAASRSRSSTIFSISEAGKVGSPNSSAGTTASDDPRSVRPGAHGFLVHYPARMGAKFVVVATVSGRLVGRAAAAGAFDVDGDDKPDFAAKVSSSPQSRKFLLTAGAKGLHIGMSSQALASTGASGDSAYAMNVSISISPFDGNTKRCELSRIGQSCGPVLAASEIVTASSNVLAYETTRARPRSVAVFIIGNQALAARIPGTSCFFYTNVVGMLARPVSGTGTASARFVIPKDFEGKFISQDVILYLTTSGFGIQTTNAIGVACRKG